jgi:omega-amidase
MEKPAELILEDLRVALVQADSRYDSVSGNLAHLEELLESNQESAHIFLLPELFNTGYQAAFNTRPEVYGLETTRWMKLMAKRKNAAICGSVSISEDGKTYNRMLFVLPDGSHFQYDKVNVFKFSGEDQVFSAGKELPVFTYKGWRIKPIICFDLRFPETIRNKSPYYDLILCSAHWPSPRIEAWDKLLMARAIENQAYLGAVNRVGTEGKVEYPGHSAGVDFLGKPVFPVLKQEEIKVFSCSHSELMDFRKNFPFLP